ncbi:MAG TPA: hypothetical protein VEP90_28905, partial [Methylomirabilota bacterium]|nr:hypothetical protein [Methylomirabilota bacterium]
YILTDSEAKIKAIVSAGGVKKAKAPFKPMAPGKPTWKDSNKLRRIALPLILLLAVIIGSVLSVNIVNIVNKFTNTNHHAQPAPANSSTDYLADRNEWLVEPIGSNYFFQGVQYHIQSKQPTDFSMALYDFGNTQFTNFRITVTTSEIRGVHNNGDYYGIVLRSSVNVQHYYLFEITPSDGGQYGFWRSDSHLPLKSDKAPSIISNFGQSNVIAIIVKGNSFTFYVNNEQLGKPVIDTSNQPLSSGAIGLSVEGQNTEVAFSQLHIDRL